MSYATYLKDKLAAQKKVVNVRNPTDASQYTHKKRLQSTQIFFADGQGSGSLAMDTSRPAGTPLLQHASVSYSKRSTRPADASVYTAYRGAMGINTDSEYRAGGKANLPCVDLPDPTPAKYKGAGDVTKDKIACDKSNALLKPALFVDNTIRLSAMQSDMITATSCCERDITKANHEHSEGLHLPVRPTSAHGKRSELVRNPPQFQNQGVGGSRIGAYFNPRSGYVENKHGNDLGVTRRSVPTPWKFSPNAPAHLKINDPTFANVKPV